MALPVVASPVPGITDLLENGGAQLGVLTSANTAEAFADAIEAIQSDSDFQARLGAACRDRVASTYSQETMFESYNNLVSGYR